MPTSQMDTLRFAVLPGAQGSGSHRRTQGAFHPPSLTFLAASEHVAAQGDEARGEQEAEQHEEGRQHTGCGDGHPVDGRGGAWCLLPGKPA